MSRLRGLTSAVMLLFTALPALCVKPPDRLQAPTTLTSVDSRKSPYPEAPKGKDERHAQDEFNYRESRQQGMTCVYGTVHGNIAWKKAKSPYLMVESVFVAEDGALRIEPGVRVEVVRPEDTHKYNTHGYSIYAHGKLQASGRPDARIVFTSASATPENANEWGGIEFYGVQPNVLRWAVIEYAGFGVECNGSPLIAHCVFRNCHTGIWCFEGFMGSILHNVSMTSMYGGVSCNSVGANATIRDNIFYRNGIGINAWGNAVPYADYNVCYSGKFQSGCGGGGRGGGPTYQGMEPGKHDLQADPKFVNPEKGDFRLAKDSPARRAGSSGSDLGLDAENWSERSAKMELDTWLAGGSRALWYKGMRDDHSSGHRSRSRFPKRDSRQASYEQALALKPEPELRCKILCSLGRALNSEQQTRQAQAIFNKALAGAKTAHLRDLARRGLAECLAQAGNPARALLLVNQVEWPQSRVWARPDAAKYSALMGDAPSALKGIAELKTKEPYRYVESLSEMIAGAIGAGKLDPALNLLDGYKDFPICEKATQSRVALANALREKKRSEDAARVLRECLELDSFGRQGAQNMETLADILETDLLRTQEADEVRRNLVVTYYPLDQVVARVRARLGERAPISPREKTVLLDASLGESSIYDRDLYGSCNFGQYEALRALVDAGYQTHQNERSYDRDLPAPDVLRGYGLIVMNGRYGGTDDPPMPDGAIESLASYVKEGGSLLIVSGGHVLGEGREPEFYNRLIGRFGLRFKEGVTLPSGDRTGRVTDHPAVSGLKGFWAEHGVPVETVKGQAVGFCGNEPVIALAEYGAGRVVIAGLGSGFMGQCMGKDEGERAEMNKALLVKLAGYLLAPRRQQAGLP
ncbi:MAG: hypothetical protein Q7T82_10640 [Armatimonadota bacterium]|nr:hypothetical protein [Armatimonadota bacterium]